MNGFGFVVLPFTVKHNTLGDFLRLILLWFFFLRAGGGGGGGALCGFQITYITFFCFRR